VAEDDVNTHHGRQAGFTLIEVMVSIIITAIVVMGLIGLFKSQSSASAFSRHNTEAAVLAEHQIEWLRTQGIAATGSGSGLGSAASGSNYDAEGVAGAGIFTIYWNELLITGASSYAEIWVTVTWSDDGVSHSLVMQGRRDP
jgi:prepilin-type N-terminal cleavage/methylation domain-containing protein